MSSKELPDLSEMRHKISDMEKENLELRNQVEILNNELSQKTNILSQTNSELTDLQKQYKQALEKIVELSKKTSGRGLSPEEERIYRLQLAEQASCISTLQDRLWESENHRKFTAFHSSSTNSFEQAQQMNNNNYYNYQQSDCTSGYRRPSFCDPIPNIDRAEKKIISLHHKLIEVSKQNDFFYNELNSWSKFVMQIFNIAAEALDEYPDYPYDDPPAQRKAALNAVCKLAKSKNEAPRLYEKYMKMKEKYQEAKEYLNKIEQKCNHLSQVTNIRTVNTNKFKKQNIIDSDSSSGFNEDFAHFQKRKSYNKNMTRNASNQMSSNSHNFYHQSACSNIQNEFEDENMQQPNKKIYSKPKFDEKKIENYSSNVSYKNTRQKEYDNNEYDQFLEDQSENININKNKHLVKNQCMKGSNNLNFANNRQKSPKTNQTSYNKQEIITNKNERIINTKGGSDFNTNSKHSNQNKTKISINKTIKHQSKEQTNKFNHTYPKGKNSDDESDDLYSKFGANISRLSKITENMKNDYYDFAKLTKEIDVDSYSIEELSNMNSL